MDQPVPSPEPVTPEKGRGPNKIANSLVALSSAAVLTVYAAGYLRTRSAAARFAVEAADLRTAIPPGATAGPPAEAPREFVDAGKPAEATPAVPASPGPNSVAGEPPSPIASPESLLPPIADSTESAGPKGPALQPTPSPEPARSQPAPSPIVEPAPPSFPEAATTDAAPAAVDSAKAEPPAPPPAPRQGQYKDGTFSGWGYSRHGDIEAAVVVRDGRVVSAEITQCLTRYSCSVIDMLPAQVLGRQNAFVDLISGATESAVAYSNAIYRALKLAK